MEGFNELINTAKVMKNPWMSHMRSASDARNLQG